MCHQHLHNDNIKFRHQPENVKCFACCMGLFFTFLLTFPFGLGALAIDMVRIFLYRENSRDESYFFIYVDEIVKYTKELLCLPHI